MNTPQMLDCGHMSTPTENTPGYGQDPQGKKICFDCCANGDKEYMRKHGKIMLYLTRKDGRYTVSNWPGTLSFYVREYSKSRHNMGRERVDVWFVFEGYIWHGYQIGDYNEVCHCQKTKKMKIA